MGKEEIKGRGILRKILEDRNEKMRRLLIKMEAEATKKAAADVAREQKEIRAAVAEVFHNFCVAIEEAAAAVTKIWGAIQAAEEFRKALRWAEVANRPLAARYHRTKKKRIRKKYAKLILAWYREEILQCCG